VNMIKKILQSGKKKKYVSEKTIKKRIIDNELKRKALKKAAGKGVKVTKCITKREYCMIQKDKTSKNNKKCRQSKVAEFV